LSTRPVGSDAHLTDGYDLLRERLVRESGGEVDLVGQPSGDKARQVVIHRSAMS
jgi:hypothetical protein